MSYQRAKHFFDDNQNHASASNNPAIYNLSQGLAALTYQLMHDVSDMKRKLDQLEHDVRQIKNR